MSDAGLGSVRRWVGLVLAALCWAAVPGIARAQNGDAGSCYYLDFNGHRIGPYPASNLANAYAVMTSYGYTLTGWFNACTNDCSGDGCGRPDNNGGGCYFLNFNHRRYGPFSGLSLGYVYQYMTTRGFTMTGWINTCTGQCAGDACAPSVNNDAPCYYLDFNGQRIGPYPTSALSTVYTAMISYGYAMTGWINTCTGQCAGDGCH